MGPESLLTRATGNATPSCGVSRKRTALEWLHAAQGICQLSCPLRVMSGGCITAWCFTGGAGPTAPSVHAEAQGRIKGIAAALPLCLATAKTASPHENPIRMSYWTCQWAYDGLCYPIVRPYWFRGDKSPPGSVNTYRSGLRSAWNRYDLSRGSRDPYLTYRCVTSNPVLRTFAHVLPDRTVTLTCKNPMTSGLRGLLPRVTPYWVTCKDP
jgi:hypothetical protein